MLRIPTHRAPTHPGEMFREEFRRPLQLTQAELAELAELAERLGVWYPRVNELVHGKRSMTPDTALRLERFLAVEAQFRLNLQLAWDLDHASHSAAARQIAKIKPLNTDAAGRPASTKRRVAAA